MSKSKCEAINTTESSNIRINTVESIRKPFLNINLNQSYLPLKLIHSKSKKKAHLQNSHNNSLQKPKIKTSLNSPDKSIEDLKNAIKEKEKEISFLKNQLLSKDKYISEMESEIISLKTNKTEVSEYDEYAKKQMMRNVKLLQAENFQLRDEVNKFKLKEIKMMKLLYNLNKKGIPIDSMIDCAEEEIGTGAETDKTNGTFIPLIDEGEVVKNLVRPDIVPKLNFDQLNQKFNENYFSPLVNNKQSNSSVSATTGCSNVNTCSHEFLPKRKKGKEILIKKKGSKKKANTSYNK